MILPARPRDVDRHRLRVLFRAGLPRKGDGGGRDGSHEQPENQQEANEPLIHCEFQPMCCTGARVTPINSTSAEGGRSARIGRICKPACLYHSADDDSLDLEGSL